MSLPIKGSRKIVMDGETYYYHLKHGRGQYIGDSGACMWLILKVGEHHHSFRLKSKLWDPDLHIDCWASHKVKFTPKDVSIVVKGLLLNGNVSGVQLDCWEIQPA